MKINYEMIEKDSYRNCYLLTCNFTVSYWSDKVDHKLIYQFDHSQKIEEIIKQTILVESIFNKLAIKKNETVLGAIINSLIYNYKLHWLREIKKIEKRDWDETKLTAFNFIYYDKDGKAFDLIIDHKNYREYDSMINRELIEKIEKLNMGNSEAISIFKRFYETYYIKEEIEKIEKPNNSKNQKI